MNAPAVYADVPYSNRPHPQSHPDLLAAGALVRGMDPPDPATARVLELGCNAGGNLIGLAYAHPGMRVHGIDYTAPAIESALMTARQLGLGNASFEVADIRELTDGRLGTFDYVLAHGIYAWVPDDVRDALLAAITAHLAPDGLAYVSYNAHPGGHLRRVLREGALWHGRDAATRLELAASARELFALLREVRGGREATDWYGAGLDTELHYLETADDALIVHDILADAWEPAWVSDLAAHAARHGLGYVGPARLDDLRRRADEDEQRALRGFAGEDPVARDELLDLLTFRRFRETVLCHGDPPPPAAPRLDRLRFTSAPRQPGPEAGDAVAAVARVLDEAWPHGRDLAQLREATGLDGAALERAVLTAFRDGLADPHATLPDLACPGERPRASALARLQAAGDGPITTLYHGLVFMDDPLGRALLALMDGSRDHAALLRDFVAATGVAVDAEVLEGNVASLGRLPLFHG